MQQLDFTKSADGLLPAIVQDAVTKQVLMLGYMNEAALGMTEKNRRVTFFSRKRNTLWTKGETSGNFLAVVSIEGDCDSDTILIQALPEGPTCHRGTVSCFGDGAADSSNFAFLPQLIATIGQRFRERPEGSYVAKLLELGLDRMAQKVGEEAVETVIAAKNSDRDAFVGEAADLFFHLLVLLEAKGSSFQALLERLEERHK